MIKTILLAAIAALLFTGSFTTYTESAAPGTSLPPSPIISSTLSSSLPSAEVAEEIVFPSIAAATAAPAEKKAVGSTATASLGAVARDPAPSVPATGASATTAAPAQAETPAATPGVTTPDYPSRLLIPSISFDQRIIPVGLTAEGAMDVPSGNTLDVGWLKTGTIPGNTGSAVLDAHVFAAFAKLKYLSVGDSIYVKDRSGQTLHFVVRSATTYLLSDMDLAVRKFIFNKADGKYLNLITCAGKLTADRSTYTHRLVIHAELVQ